MGRRSEGSTRAADLSTRISNTKISGPLEGGAHPSTDHCRLRHTWGLEQRQQAREGPGRPPVAAQCPEHQQEGAGGWGSAPPHACAVQGVGWGPKSWMHKQTLHAEAFAAPHPYKTLPVQTLSISLPARGTHTAT